MRGASAATHLHVSRIARSAAAPTTPATGTVSSGARSASAAASARSSSDAAAPGALVRLDSRTRDAARAGVEALALKNAVVTTDAAVARLEDGQEAVRRLPETLASNPAEALAELTKLLGAPKLALIEKAVDALAALPPERGWMDRAPALIGLGDTFRSVATPIMSLPRSAELMAAAKIVFGAVSFVENQAGRLRGILTQARATEAGLPTIGAFEVLKWDRPQLLENHERTYYLLNPDDRHPTIAEQPQRILVGERLDAAERAKMERLFAASFQGTTPRDGVAKELHDEFTSAQFAVLKALFAPVVERLELKKGFEPEEEAIFLMSIKLRSELDDLEGRQAAADILVSGSRWSGFEDLDPETRAELEADTPRVMAAELARILIDDAVEVIVDHEQNLGVLTDAIEGWINAGDAFYVPNVFREVGLVELETSEGRTISSPIFSSNNGHEVGGLTAAKNIIGVLDELAPGESPRAMRFYHTHPNQGALSNGDGRSFDHATESMRSRFGDDFTLLFATVSHLNGEPVQFVIDTKS